MSFGDFGDDLSLEGPGIGFFLPVIIPAIIMFFLFFACAFWMFWPMCKGQYAAKNATVLPPEEAQPIINSMQGDWDVSVTTGICQGFCFPITSCERMTVTGSVILNKYPRARRSGYREIHLRPARIDDGTLLLDTLGSRALVFTPEQGIMQTETWGRKCEWKKVEEQENVTQKQRSRAGQVASSGPGGVAASSGPGGVADEIQRLNQLKQQGVLTEEEFSAAKFKILNPGEPCANLTAPYEQPPPYPTNAEAGVPLMEKKY